MQLDDRAVFLLSQLGHHVADRFTEDLAPLGIRPAQYGVLNHLRDGDGRSQQELADLLTVHRNVMVGLIDELEADGLVRRMRHPDDRRAHAVHLTDAARAVLREADRLADAVEADLLSPVPAAERGRLLATLHEIAARAGLPAGVHPGLHRRTPRRAGRPSGA